MLIFHTEAPSQIDAEIEEIKSILKESEVNMGAIEAYRVKDSEYIKRLKDLQNCKKTEMPSVASMRI